MNCITNDRLCSPSLGRPHSSQGRDSRQSDDQPFAALTPLSTPTPLPSTPAKPVAAHGPSPVLNSQIPASDRELRNRCILDTAARAATGIYIYPAIWLILIIVTGVAEQAPAFAWGQMGLLSLLAALRTYWNHQLPQGLAERPERTEQVFNTLTLMMAFHWGVLTGLCLHWFGQSTLGWVMLVATIGFCTGGNTMFAINPALRYRYPFTMIAPVFVAQGLNPTSENLMMIGLQTGFAVYLVRSSSVIQADYWEARHAQRLAEQRARELEVASLTDGLTKVPNRIHFDRQFEHEWSRQCRHGRPTAILLIDLDHFKKLNDTHGHAFGDRCLIEAAQALRRACARGSDMVARYGGEEFIALLPETDVPGALAVAQDMLDEVRRLDIHKQGQRVPITCSIGVAVTIPQLGHDPDELIHQADVALYQAKAQGRDRHVLSAPTDQPQPRA